MNKFYVFIILGFFIAVFSLLFSCALPSKIVVEYDDVKSVTRIKDENSYKIVERNHSIAWFGKTFYREKNSAKNNLIKVYDVLKFYGTTVKLEDSIFIVTDKSKIYPISLQHYEKEILRNIEPKKEDIIKADSTKISVITGYEEFNYTIVSFNYNLNQEMREAILEAHELKFRYYIGFNMITVKIEKRDLENLKKMLEM